MKKYYIAYGSNLNTLQMRRRCPDARILGTGRVKDYRLLFKGSRTGAYLTIEKKEGAGVPVGIWEVSEADEKRLDRYEGFPDFYYKTEMEIEYVGFVTGKKRKVKAFVYIMNENSRTGIPSVEYVNICEEGYCSFGFDVRYLDEALSESFREARS